MLEQYPWNAAKAFDVLYCESTGDPRASNGTHWGLMQLSRGPYYDPAENIYHAYHDYYAAPNGHGGIRGWQPWSCA